MNLSYLTKFFLKKLFFQIYKVLHKNNDRILLENVMYFRSLYYSGYSKGPII